MRALVLVIVLLVTSGATAESAVAGEWPTEGRTMFRTSYTVSVPEAGLAPRWSVQAGAALHAGPVVKGDHVLFGSDDGTLYSLSTLDGSLRWKFSPLARIRAGATVVDDLVFLAGYDGNLYGLELETGWLRWQLTTASWINASPAVGGNTVIAASYAGVIYAVEARTGRLRWQHSVGGDFIEQSPAIAGQALYVVTAGGRLLRLSLATGEHEWTARLGGRPVSPPVITGDSVIVVCRDQGDDGGIFAVSAGDGSIRWTLSEPPNDWLPPAAGLRRVVLARANELVLVDEATGRAVTTIEIEGEITGQPVYAGNRIVVPVNNGGTGYVTFVDLETGFQWPVRLGPVPTTTLAVTHSSVYVGADNNRMYALSLLSVMAGGAELQFGPVWPFLLDGQVIVPVRRVLEALGAEIRWNHDRRTALVRHGERTIILRLDAGTGLQLVQGRLMGPIRPLAEALNIAIQWDPMLTRVTLRIQTDSGGE